MRIAVSTPAEIAARRFLPSVAQIEGLDFAGISAHSRVDEAKALAEKYGGTFYESFDALCADPDIDAVYIPSVPAAHFTQAKKALAAGKHVMLEKPFTLTYEEAVVLGAIAGEKGLALHENFTFLYHPQLKEIRSLIGDGTIGTVRLVRCSFGFPARPSGDFRYDKSLGGGALMDCGCYTIRLASVFLGDQAKITQAALSYEGKDPATSPDIAGAGVLENKDGLTAQLAFGMNNAYRCMLEVWGSRAYLSAGRIFTAPDDLAPPVTLAFSDHTEERTLSPSPSFASSISHFVSCTKDAALRKAAIDEILCQARHLSDFARLAARM